MTTARAKEHTMKKNYLIIPLILAALHTSPLKADVRSPSPSAHEGLPSALVALLEQAQALRQEEKYPEALEALLEAHRQHPENPEIRLRIGEMYMHMNQESRTLEYWEPLSREYPQNVALKNNIAHIYINARDESLRNSQRAINYARDALLTNPLVYPAWQTLAEAYLANGDFAKAMHAAKRSRDLAELVQAPEEQIELSDDLIRKTRMLSQAVEAYPLPQPEEDEMDEIYWVKLGEYASARGRFREALGAFGIALTHNPENRAALFGQALVYIATKDYDLALELLHVLEQRFPYDQTLKNNMAWLYATAEDPAIRNAEKALAYAQDAIMIDPNNFQIWNTLSEAHFISGNYERAMRASENSVRQAQLANAPATQIQRYMRQVERCRLAAEAMSIID